MVVAELELARQFDQQMAKLFELSPHHHRRVSLSQADRQLARSTIDGIRETCDLIQLKLDELADQIEKESTSRQLLGQFRQMIGLEVEMETEPEQDFHATECTENHHTPRKIDFDAFPATPTLEELGISGQSLALVGAPRGATLLSPSFLSVKSSETEKTISQNRTLHHPVQLSSPSSSGLAEDDYAYNQHYFRSPQFTPKIQ